MSTPAGSVEGSDNPTTTTAAHHSSNHNHNNAWRTPSDAHCTKYQLNPLPEDFEPTPAETALLDMYDVVRNYERTAARLKEEAARAKLAARDAEFQSKLKPNKRKRKVKAATMGDDGSMANDDDDDDDADDLSDMDSDDNEGSDEDEKDLHARREAKLVALRQEVQDKQVAIAPSNEDDVLREQHLAADSTVMDGPVLKRRKKEEADVPSSLIANLTAAVTPPHDFSNSLELRVGRTLFPVPGSDDFKWTPPPEGEAMSPNEGAFEVELEDFDVARAQNGTGNNTLAIKFMAPPDAKRFSINLASVDNDSFNSVLFHFNPRQRERGGQLVVNDKQEGTWGQAIQLPLSQIPLMFGQTACTLQIQINGEGFDVFLENQHCLRLEHRIELQSGTQKLVLQFPSTDDYGNPENWVVYKVWWGNRPVLAKADVVGVPGVNSFNSIHPRKMFVSGLAKIFTESDTDLRRAELERAFAKYGGDRGVQVIVPTNTTYAFVECETERMADLALQEMSNKYRMNRARRSRHEALQEERAAKEAAKLGGHGKTESTKWD